MALGGGRDGRRGGLLRTARALGRPAAGAAGKLVGRPGLFYEVVGHDINAIDGPTDYSVYPANVSAKLAPKDPDQVAAQISAAIRERVPERYRDTFHGTVVMDDVLAAAPHWPTINHPDIATLMTLAQRTLDRAAAATGAEAGLTVVHPGRELLGGLEAPVLIDAATVLAAQLRPGARAEVWQSRDWDAPVSVAQVAAEQIVFCRRAGFLDAALTRCRERIEILGLDALLP